MDQPQPLPPAAHPERVRRWCLVLPIVVVVAIAMAYRPALKHVPHSDHECFLIETLEHDDFVDLVRHTYSWTRTRLFGRGDTQLYRPLLFAWLSGLKAGFGTHWERCQALGIALHAVIAVILFFLVREILAGGEGRASFAALPLGVALFFGLNHAIAEQVIWFHIQPYMVAILLILGSCLLLLRATRSDASCNARRGCLGGAWLSVLSAAFFYELGQFAAFAAALFLLTAPWANRRTRMSAAAAFLGIIALYQTANHLDRRAHQGTYSDDLKIADILERVPSVATAENSVRYALYTTVSPFTRSPIGFLNNGKLFVPENVWYSDELHLHTSYEVEIRYQIADMPILTYGGWLVAIVGGILAFVGLVHWVRGRDRAVLARVVLFGGVGGAQAALVVLGRMNFRADVEPLGLNSHYTYSALLWSLALVAVLIAPLASRRSLRNPIALFAIGMIALGIDGGCRLQRLNFQLAEAFRPSRVCWRSLTHFFDAHRHEPDFTYAIAIDPTEQIPNYSDVLLPFVANCRHFDRDRPQYVLRFQGTAFESMTIEEYRRQHAGPPQFYARLVRLGRGYHVFERDGTFFAIAVLDQIRRFLYTPLPAEDPSFRRSVHLPSLLEWIAEHTAP